MAIRTATAVWNGSIKEGSGTVSGESGAFEVPYDFVSRFESGPLTNPEELIGAAHAGCYSMFLSSLLTKAGTPPTKIATSARVHLEVTDSGPVIPRIELTCEAEVPGIDQATLLSHAEEAKAKCPVSKVLSGAQISLEAKLTG